MEMMDSDVAMINNKMLVEFDCKCKPTCDQRNYKLVTKKPKQSYKKLVQNIFGETYLKEVVIEEGTPITQVSDYILSNFLHGIIQVLDIEGDLVIKKGYVLKVEYNMLIDEEVTYTYEGSVSYEQIHNSGKDVILDVWIEEK